MIRLSLTDLVDIVSKSGTPKATKVKNVKERPDYLPAHDFYKPLREHIINLHKGGGDSKDLDIGRIMYGSSDKKKGKLYPLIIQGYRKWWGRRNFQWFDPPKSTYASNDVEVMVNPELGLEFDNEKHLVKLYFKEEKLSKLRVDIITHLMELQLRSSRNQKVKMSVLDIRNSKLITYDGGSVIRPVIDAELAYISSLWSSI